MHYYTVRIFGSAKRMAQLKLCVQQAMLTKGIKYEARKDYVSVVCTNEGQRAYLLGYVNGLNDCITTKAARVTLIYEHAEA